MSETERRGGGKKLTKDFPVVEKLDIDVDKIGDEIQGIDNGAPILYMFFKKGNFDLAEISADNCIIQLCTASVINVILGYIAVYYVFHVGYSPNMSHSSTSFNLHFLGKRNCKG